MTGTIRFARILSRTDRIAAQLHGLQFSSFHPPDSAWQPAINVYEYADHIEVCVDLAGVRPQDLTVHVEARRLIVRGHRVPPACAAGPSGCGRILIMEIGDGPFERTIDFRADIDSEGVRARHENGWLWIRVPLA
jgi:HSP20 family protein